MANGIESRRDDPAGRRTPGSTATTSPCVEAGGRPVVGRDGSGLRELVRHLRGGGVMAILLDQYTKGGAMIDFLGHPAPTGTVIAELALKYRLPMIPVYGTRRADGVHVDVDFEAADPAGHRRSDDPGRRRQPRRPRPRPSRSSTSGCTAAG